MEITKPFKYWIAQDVEEAFNITRTRQSDVLDNWLAAQPAITAENLHVAERLREKLEFHVDNWNEAALKFFHIGPLVSLVDFTQDRFTGFLEQTLSVETANVKSKGNIDFMVATGSQAARAPFYLLHEYKPEFNSTTDAKGQLLIAMVAAQKQNEKEGLQQPVYGTYVLGRLWFFVVLTGQQYTNSRAYDATQPDDHQVIFRALHTVKHYIQELLAKLP